MGGGGGGVVVVVLVVVVVFTLENRLFQSPKKKPSYSNPINFLGANLRKLISFATGIRSGLREAESPRLKHLLDP